MVHFIGLLSCKENGNRPKLYAWVHSKTKRHKIHHPKEEQKGRQVRSWPSRAGWQGRGGRRSGTRGNSGAGTGSGAAGAARLKSLPEDCRGIETRSQRYRRSGCTLRLAHRPFKDAPGRARMPPLRPKPSSQAGAAGLPAAGGVCTPPCRKGLFFKRPCTKVRPRRASEAGGAGLCPAGRGAGSAPAPAAVSPRPGPAAASHTARPHGRAPQRPSPSPRGLTAGGAAPARGIHARGGTDPIASPGGGGFGSSCCRGGGSPAHTGGGHQWQRVLHRTDIGLSQLAVPRSPCSETPVQLSLEHAQRERASQSPGRLGRLTSQCTNRETAPPKPAYGDPPALGRDDQ